MYRRERYNQFGLQLWLDVAAVDNFTVDENNFCSFAKERTAFNRHFDQPTLANQPQYVLNAINGLPALRFDGVDDFMNFSDQGLTWLNDSSFTIFIVATKTNEPDLSFIIGGQSTADNSNLGLGYVSQNTYRTVFGGDDVSAVVPITTPGDVELFTVKFDNNNKSRLIYRNSIVFGLDAAEAPLGNMSGQALGRFLSSFGQFDLGDILIYNRPLSDYEREVIERDLISKWSISSTVVENPLVPNPEPEPTPPDPEEPTDPDPGVTTFINVTNDGANAFLVDDVSNGTISVTRGADYEITVDALGHPFWIQSVAAPYSLDDVYSGGLVNNGTDSGVITWTVPLDAPDTLYYACELHAAMGGTINVID